MQKRLLTVLFLLTTPLTHADTAPTTAPAGTPSNRVASIYISQDFINDQLKLHVKSPLVQNMNIILNSKNNELLLNGEVQVPVEELRAINLDSKMGRFKFQMALKLETTPQGHLIVQFPMNETYFYPLLSKNRISDRIVVPVQMLSIALASVRGYLAALSGDFSGFDRQTKKLEALIKSLDRSITIEKNADALEYLKVQKESIRLQLEAVPVERKQLQAASKSVESMLGFTGENELNLNEALTAQKNSLIFKIKLSQLTPYLKDIELGGIRVIQDKKDGDGKESFLVIDANDHLARTITVQPHTPSTNRTSLKTPPSLIIRLNQALLESEALLSAEKKDLGSSLRDFQIELKNDGLHVSGKWHKFFLTVPFDTIVDFKSTALDTFEVKVREMDVAGISFEFLSRFALEALKNRLDHSLKGICTFQYKGEESDHSRALQVTVNPKTLVPAFPGLHLVDVEIKEKEFLLKVGATL